jgi:hypothetical protein
MKNMMFKLAFILAVTASLFHSCKQGASPDSEERTQSIAEEGNTAQMTGIVKVSEQIVYDVEIKNPYPDDAWMEECLQDLDRETLVNFIFSGLYQGKFKAFDIFEGTPVKLRKIRKMEEKGEFTRDQIGKFQFQEEWILDTVRMIYSKQVREVRMGLQKFNDEGELTGYAPLLRVVL